MAEEKRNSDDVNVMMMTAIIVVFIIILSLVVLWFLTRNFYLSADYVIETFFGAPNVYADSILSAIASSDGIFGFSIITAIVIVDNLSKILILSFILAAVFDIISYKNIDNFLNKFRAHGLSNHVVICGYNRVSDMLSARLKSENIPFIFMEHDPDKVVDLNDKELNFVPDDYKTTNSLRLAGVGRARAVVLASQNDLDNILGAIASRRINKKVKIIARVGNEEAIAKMHSIGVDVCLITERLVGTEMGEELTKIVKK